MMPMATNTVRPTPPKMGWRSVRRRPTTGCASSVSFLRLWYIRPNMITQAPGRIIMLSSSVMSEMMVGFSSGVVELAPRKPPPLVPRCLMETKEAMGPMAMVWKVPSRVFNTTLESKFWGTPCHTSNRPPTMENGSSRRVVMRVRSAKKLPTSSLVLPVSPRINAMQAA